MPSSLSLGFIEDDRLQLLNHHLIVCPLFKAKSLEIQQFCGGTVPA